MAMGGVAARISAIISADASGYTKAMKGVTAATAGGTTAVKGFGASLKALAITFAAFFAVFKAVGFVVNTVKLFIDFEEQLFRTSAIMKQFTLGAEEQAIAMGKLEDEIRSVAAGSKFTATEVGAMAETLALAGLSLDQMRGATSELDETAGNALKTMVDFAVVAGTDVETAAGIGIASLKGFRLPIEDLERVTSVLANTFTSSFVNLQQLGDSMRFFGPTAAAAGVSISEAAAAVGALGDAGLQGSMAGTGLRQAINKLIAPTDDARRTMERLGFEFTTLTPAGLAAKEALGSTIRTIDDLESTISSANMELKSLNNELNDMGIQEEKNSINIARIRQRASRQNRDLTKTEMATIKRLESANEDLALAQREGALESRQRERALDKSTDSLAEQNDAFKILKDTVDSQTTGVSSLVDMIEELNSSGATTAEILEIFGVRGGGSILALQGNAAALREIAEANELVFAATDMNNTLQDQMVRQLEGSVAFALAETRSKFEELSLVIGEPFARLITMEGGIKQTLDAAIERAATMGDEFQMIADSVETELLPAFAEAFKPGNVENFIKILGDLVPEILKIVGVIGKLAEIIEPILDGILFVMEKMSEFKDFVGDDNEDRQGRLVGKEGESTFDSLADVGKFTAAGAIAGTAIPIPGVGTIAGAVAGLTVGIVHEVGQAVVHHTDNALDDETDILGNPLNVPMAVGGIVTTPTKALVGEAGAEAVIPLNRLPDLIPQIVLPASSNEQEIILKPEILIPTFTPSIIEQVFNLTNNAPEIIQPETVVPLTEMVNQINSTSSTENTEQVINLTFDSINIGSGNNVTAGDVRQIIENEMPKIIRSSLTRGVRGVL